MRVAIWLWLSLALALFPACSPISEASSDAGAMNTLSLPTESLSLEADEQEPLALPSFQLLAVGDNLIHEPIYTMAHHTAIALGQEGYNFLPSYAGVAEAISAADFAFLEQEVLVSGEEYLISAWPSFNAPRELARDMRELGFDIVNLANNHILDKDVYCLEKTLDVWQENSMPWIGVYDSRSANDALYIATIEGCRVAFLGYTYGLNSWEFSDGLPFVIGDLNDRHRMQQDLAYARSQSDLLVVSLHWGDEYQLQPSESQRELALWLAMQQVDLIIGHHPHVIQPTEVVERPDGGRLTIVYSLGNFISCQRRVESLLGLMLTIEANKSEDGAWSLATPLLTPLISHYEHPEGDQPHVEVLPLHSYSETLAADHDLANDEADMSLAVIQALYERVIDTAYRP